MASDTRLQNGALSTTQVGAYNVYTGARYVPLIVGEWDSTKNYEPLTIVINQGNSYTSAQYVPAGIPLQENGPYWFKTGNFNGQISIMESQIDALTESVSQNILNINNLTNIQGYLLSAIPSKLNIVTMGDSYSIVHTGSTKAWPSYLQDFLQLPSSQIINIGVDGGGFCVSEDKQSITQWNNFKNSHPERLNSINMIIIAQGANDYTFPQSQIITNMTSCINQIKNDCPKARIIISAIGARLSSNLLNYYDIVERGYRTGAMQNNVEFIPLGLYSWMNDGCINTDLIHPTALGCKYIAEYLFNYIISKNTLVNARKLLINCTVGTGGTGSGEILQFIDNSQPIFYFSAGYHNLTSSLVVTTQYPLLGAFASFTGPIYMEKQGTSSLNIISRPKVETVSGIFVGIGYGNGNMDLVE